MRVQYARREYTAILPLLQEAEALANKYEYNDHLASLRLTQGHIAQDLSCNRGESKLGASFDAPLVYYQQALIYALRYNRFLLDEVLWGGNLCTPLQAIIPFCLARGEEGRSLLLALRNWWQSGLNNVGPATRSTNSPIPVGIPLVQAECLARQRERGDGSEQVTVSEMLEMALQKAPGSQCE